jgi:hypothetical protein
VAALTGLRAIYKASLKMAIAGVILVDISDAAVDQGEIDLEVDVVEDRSPRINAVMAGGSSSSQVKAPARCSRTGR